MKKILFIIPLCFILSIISLYVSEHIDQLHIKIKTLEKEDLEYKVLTLKTTADSLLIAHQYDTALSLYHKVDSIYQSDSYTENALRFIEDQKVPFEKINELEKRYYTNQKYIYRLKQNQVELFDSINVYKTTNHLLTSDKGKLELDLQKNKKTIKNLQKELVSQNKDIERLDIQNYDGAEIKYIGEVFNGNAHGFGYAVFEKTGFYEGLWENNRRNGQGVYTWENGDRFEGNYKAGIRDGFGVYFFKSGERYEGFWSNNLREGFGVLFNDKNEVIFEGIWKKDKPKNKKLTK
ncbi:hypothetical protein [Flammeovirga sp. SubArs3]|uniref:MORN repeat-containing protein n=1 Tax=Flammeovirga sp. SubArs3 TaxID=2995316 RepID=UPI00248CDABD|nr:hypothetical protein [Flammeovirga sp. SubArs3]